MDDSDYERRMRAALGALYWGAGSLAGALGVRADTAGKWLAGKSRMPAGILAWLERLAAFHRANPPPGAPDRETPDAPEIPP